MKIAELRPFMKKVELSAKVVEKNEIREVSSKLDDSTHKVTEALIGDDSGTVMLTLWDKTIEEIKIGKTYKFSNAYTSLFKNSLRVNLGRYGTHAEEKDIEIVKTENNISEKEFGKNL